MNSDTKFPATIPPFRYPVPPPDAEPDDAPLVQVCLNFDWMAYVLGALKSLMLQATWATDDPDVRELALQRAEFLIGMFMQAAPGCANAVPNILCISGSFADDPYGYVPAIAAPCSPAYVPGTGWQSCFNSTGGDQIDLIRPFDTSTFVRSYEYHTDGTALISYTITVTLFLHGAQVYQLQQTFGAGGPGSIGDTPNVQADLVLVEVNDGALVSSSTLTLVDWSLCYTGDFPMSQPPTVWTSTFDFTVSLYGLTLNYGVWTNGVGIVGDPHFGADIVAGFDINVSPDVHIETAIMVYSMSGGGGTDNGVRLGFVIGGTFVPTFLITTGTDGTNRPFGGPVNEDVSLINCTLNTGNLTGSDVIISLTLTGTGTKPASFP